jgi:serine/threonine protein phosphatase PrpC
VSASNGNRLSSAALTDPGTARSNNEDIVFKDDDRGIYVVIDGMGGQAAGEEAARIALEHVRTRLLRAVDTVDQRLREAIVLANNAILKAAQNNPEWRGMGCVLTAAIIEGDTLTVGHVGDTRLYKIRKGIDEALPRGLGVVKLTHDHSPVGESEDNHELDEEQAIRHPRRNEVYRDLGSEPHSPHDTNFVEIVQARFEPDSAVLLCTDGLTDVVRRKQIRDIVEQSAGNGAVVARRLIDAANEQSKDNVSVVYVEGPRFAASLRNGAETEPQVTASIGIGTLAFKWIPILAMIGMALYVFWPRANVSNAPRTLQVGVEKFATIGAALAEARSGDTVQAAPGQYHECIQMKAGVTVVGDPGKVALLPPPNCGTAAVTAENIQSGRLSGFTIKPDGAYAPEIGVLVRDSAIELQFLEITGMRSAAVDFKGSSSGELTGSVLEANPGAGVVVEDAAAPRIERNFIVRNGVRKPDPLPGIWYRSSSPPHVRDNLLLDNGSEGIRGLPNIPQSEFEKNFFGDPKRHTPPAPSKENRNAGR